MVTDQIADLLTCIRNASRAGHACLRVPGSKKRAAIVKVLCEEGYIDSYLVTEEKGGKALIDITLKYDKRGQPVLRVIDRVSKPGKRVYVPKDGVKQFRGGLGTVLVSTSRGVVPDRDARALGLGGEVICRVF